MSLTSYTTAAAAPGALDPLGLDMKVGVDLDPSGRSATGLELWADALLHRLQEDELLLIGAPGCKIAFGVNVRKWVGEALSDDALAAKTPILDEVLRRDPRTADVTVKITRAVGADAARWNLLIRIQATAITGQTIDRIVGVDQVSVAFLSEGR